MRAKEPANDCGESRIRGKTTSVRPPIGVRRPMAVASVALAGVLGLFYLSNGKHRELEGTLGYQSLRITPAVGVAHLTDDADLVSYTFTVTKEMSARRRECATRACSNPGACRSMTTGRR
jgi:hypothetical protein